MSKRKTIAVIGGGSAGLTAARTAADLGARVLFFLGDTADHGSLCIEEGCMPSKAMFQPIDEMHHARRRSWFRVEPKQPEKILAQIIAWKDREIAKFRGHRIRQIRSLAARSNVQVIRSNARFIDGHTLESNGHSYRADGVIIATGSVPRIPPIKGVRELRREIWTSADILRNRRLPSSLVVIGGGSVSLEFSLRYARLGSKVSIASQSRLLPEADRHFGERLRLIYETEGVSVRTQVAVTEIRQTRIGFRVILERGGSIAAERVLLATGRIPAIESLHLERAGIDKLAIGTDMRVAGHPHVFAAGDVAGERLVVHHAHIEAGIAAQNAVRGGKRRWQKLANLQVVFTDPEFAVAGLTASQARSAGHQVIVGSEESRDVGKLHLAGDDFGFGELVVDAKTHRLLGASLLCDDASNLIHLPGYAIDHRQTVHQLADAEYYHPTKAEIIPNIVDNLCSQLGSRSPFCRAEE